MPDVEVMAEPADDLVAIILALPDWERLNFIDEQRTTPTHDWPPNGLTVARRVLQTIDSTDPTLPSWLERALSADSAVSYRTYLDLDNPAVRTRFGSASRAPAEPQPPPSQASDFATPDLDPFGAWIGGAIGIGGFGGTWRVAGLIEYDTSLIATWGARVYYGESGNFLDTSHHAGIEPYGSLTTRGRRAAIVQAGFGIGSVSYDYGVCRGFLCDRNRPHQGDFIPAQIAGTLSVATGYASPYARLLVRLEMAGDGALLAELYLGRAGRGP